ncbi:hypothetical protein B0F87_102227 [Methylobacter tundripaludum]|uniref:Uncharacterized protein n=1 Tax=Methylobacter tundripaludum TaxID=173365 RepID=A0A2S6HI30_9GAMM|nr:hypothetical protein B0F87_102227 [Methylobacter tundripaludum]
MSVSPNGDEGTGNLRGINLRTYHREEYEVITLVFLRELRVFVVN